MSPEPAEPHTGDPLAPGGPSSGASVLGHETAVAPLVTGGRRRSLRERLRDRLAWTEKQRRGMAVLLTLVLAVLAWRVHRNPRFVSDPQPAKPALYDQLADRLDPNTATWQELVAIPMLGEKRAKGIVEYREDWTKRHPGEPAYKSPIDLVVVRGIGAATVETMEPYLTFPPAAAPATRPTAP